MHKRSQFAQKVIGLKAKIYAKKRHAEKATMKKTIAMHNERENKHKAVDETRGSAVPAYLLERDQVCYSAAPCARTRTALLSILQGFSQPVSSLASSYKVDMSHAVCLSDAFSVRAYLRAAFPALQPARPFLLCREGPSGCTDTETPLSIAPAQSLGAHVTTVWASNAQRRYPGWQCDAQSKVSPPVRHISARQ